MCQLGGHRPRLLVVDDYQDSAEAISMFLSMTGYDAQYVLSGLQVLGAISACTPEIAVLDINMPRMDGFAVAQLLRKDWRTQQIVIIAFSAQDEPAIRKDGIAAGFDGYCQKGAAPDSLVRLLNRMRRPDGI